MSELQEAIQEMRNMRESYDQLSSAAEAYNEGKSALAEAITAKGVETAATDSLATMAEKVMTISQDTYEIDGGEMYAKQLFGVANNDIVPGYWNLYDILAQLLSDGRLVNYGGILLAEYYKGYASLALSGAGAGGAYVVSDKDAQGNFIMYTEDTTHVWDTEDDGKVNRFVAYCFAEEYHDFQITNTDTSPRSIFIGRKVGTITSLVNGGCSQIVVPDGNKLYSISSPFHTQNWDKKIVLRNVEFISSQFLYESSSESLYLECGELSGQAIRQTDSLTLTTIIIKAQTINLNYEIISVFQKQIVAYISAKTISGDGKLFNKVPSMLVLECESAYFYLAQNGGGTSTIYLNYTENDKTKSVSFKNRGIPSQVTIYLQDGWCKPLGVNYFTSLTEENIYSGILQRLKQDEADCGNGVTITLGATNLAKLTSQESIDLLDLLTNTYGYTFA